MEVRVWSALPHHRAATVVSVGRFVSHLDIRWSDDDMRPVRDPVVTGRRLSGVRIRIARSEATSKRVDDPGLGELRGVVTPTNTGFLG